MKSFVSIELDKVRNIRFGYKALMLIEELIGVKITKLDFDNIGIKDISILLYAGLSHEDKELTLDKIVDLIDEHSDITTVSEKIGEAMSEAFGKKQNPPQ